MSEELVSTAIPKYAQFKGFLKEKVGTRHPFLHYKILELFMGNREELTSKEAAQRVSVPIDQCQRILRNLWLAGLLDKHEETRRYPQGAFHVLVYGGTEKLLEAVKANEL